MLKALGRRMLTPVLGRQRLQPLFESLYEVSLAGLNFGEGNHPRLSGERLVIELVAGRVRSAGRRPTIFDVGANVGVYTRALVDVFGEAADIWAFEPAPSTFRMLESSLNGAAVHLRNLGFSDREGEATLYSPGEGSKLASVHDTRARLQRVGLPLALEEPVRLTTVDAFCASEGIEAVDFLKLDVEGHELKVLEGALGMIEGGRIGAIQFEFSAANLESRTYFRDFWELLSDRYGLYRVLQDGVYRIARYKESYEVFKRATNYLALLEEGSSP